MARTLNALGQAARRLFTSGITQAPHQIGVQREVGLPHGRLDFRENRTWVVVPAAGAGTEDVVTVDNDT
jgi:hypothetical protein